MKDMAGFGPMDKVQRRAWRKVTEFQNTPRSCRQGEVSYQI